MSRPIIPEPTIIEKAGQRYRVLTLKECCWFAVYCPDLVIFVDDVPCVRWV